MKIVLYKTKSDKNVLNKVLTNSITLNGNPLGELDVLTPSFTIKNSNPTGFNYCYISDYDKYYWIKSTYVSNDIWRIECIETDPLMSFKNKIENLKVIIDKQEDIAHANKMLADGTYTTTVETGTQALEFPGTLGTENVNYYITCV